MLERAVSLVIARRSARGSSLTRPRIFLSELHAERQRGPALARGGERSEGGERERRRELFCFSRLFLVGAVRKTAATRYVPSRAFVT